MVRRRLQPEQGAYGLLDNFYSNLTAGTVEKPEWPPKRIESCLTQFPRCVITSRYNYGVALLIRDFKPEDFETLWRLDQECFEPGISYSRQELKIYIRRRGAFTLVAENRERDQESKSPNEAQAAAVRRESVAGFIVAQGGTTGHIITIDVAQSARHSGVGSRLLAAAEKRLQASGSKAVGLETAVDNIGALAFYKRHGYSVVHVWSSYYSNGVDALVLSKKL
jgi:[ribosomal protein S18]-alanine N-acetyltransferase